MRLIYAAAISPPVDRVQWLVAERLAAWQQSMHVLAVWHQWVQRVAVACVAEAA